MEIKRRGNSLKDGGGGARGSTREERDVEEIWRVPLEELGLSRGFAVARKGRRRAGGEREEELEQFNK